MSVIDENLDAAAVLKGLADAFTGHPAGGAFRVALNSVQQRLRREGREQAARFASYLPVRPADEPHDAQCQVTRYGGKHCCTCKSNMIRRRHQVRNAARAGDLAFRETLGSMEQWAFDAEVARQKAEAD